MYFVMDNEMNGVTYSLGKVPTQRLLDSQILSVNRSPDLSVLVRLQPGS